MCISELNFKCVSVPAKEDRLSDKVENMTTAAKRIHLALALKWDSSASVDIQVALLLALEKAKRAVPAVLRDDTSNAVRYVGSEVSGQLSLAEYLRKFLPPF